MTRWRGVLLAIVVIYALVLIVMPVAMAFGRPQPCGDLDARIESAGEQWISMRVGLYRHVQQIALAEDGRRYLLEHRSDRLEPGDSVRIRTMCNRRGDRMLRAYLRRQG